MRDCKCSKKFPKTFAEITITGNNSYPTYRCSNGNRTVQVCGIKLDNRWDIPYNPFYYLNITLILMLRFAV